MTPKPTQRQLVILLLKMVMEMILLFQQAILQEMKISLQVIRFQLVALKMNVKSKMLQRVQLIKHLPMQLMVVNYMK